jgi:hypothetical protein
MKKLASLIVGLAAIALLALLFSLPLIAVPVGAPGGQGPTHSTVAQQK